MLHGVPAAICSRPASGSATIDAMVANPGWCRQIDVG
jgi:hypothetical protein